MASIQTTIAAEGKEDIIRAEIKHAHGALVSQISEILAKNAEYNESDVYVVTEAAKLHDIGKYYIPPEILNKPGALTTEEFEIIKTHTQSGFDFLVRQAKIYLTAAIVALQHHEKILGNGYAGTTNIHTYARLVAIADVFDALMSKRAYKSSWSVDDAVGYIQSNAHKEFDAHYVDIFTRSLDDVLGLYHADD
jgi:HD-GYP domain-containing protein (c-di-GMP phosphodiesterase class II)